MRPWWTTRWRVRSIASPGGVGESERGYSGDAVTGMLNSQRGTSLLSREEEADYMDAEFEDYMYEKDLLYEAEKAAKG